MSTKKSYKDVKENPALSYISQIQTDENKDQGETMRENAQQNHQLVVENSPSLNFTQAVSINIAPTPEGFKIKPQYSEIKTRRVQLVFPPSLFRKVKARAEEAHISVNEFVCLVLDAVVHNDPAPEE